MKKRLSFVMTALLLAGCQASPVPAGISRSVMIGNNNGSGLVMPDGRILTADHVAQNVAYPLPVEGEFLIDGTTLVMGSISESSQDLALIEVSGVQESPPLEVSCSPIEPGQKLTAIVSNEALADHVPIDLVALKTGGLKLDNMKKDVLVQGTVLPGMSGSGVYDQQGRLVGLIRISVSLKYPVLSPYGLVEVSVPTGYGSIVPPSSLCEFLKKAGYDLRGGYVERVG